jgi:hypothetical protein
LPFRLRIDDPVRAKKLIDEGVPAGGVAERRGRAGQIELVARVRTAQCFDKFAAKDATEDLHGQKEALILRTNPALAIR